MNSYINEDDHCDFQGINVSAHCFDLYNAKPIEFIRFDEPVSLSKVWEPVWKIIQKFGFFRKTGGGHE